MIMLLMIIARGEPIYDHLLKKEGKLANVNHIRD